MGIPSLALRSRTESAASEQPGKWVNPIESASQHQPRVGSVHVLLRCSGGAGTGCNLGQRQIGPTIVPGNAEFRMVRPVIPLVRNPGVVCESLLQQRPGPWRIDPVPGQLPILRNDLKKTGSTLRNHFATISETSNGQSRGSKCGFNTSGAVFRSLHSNHQHSVVRRLPGLSS